LKDRRIKRLYQERKITRLKDLPKFIQSLDEDEGIRIEGSVKGLANGGLIFLGFYRGQYCVNMRDKIWKPRLGRFMPGEDSRYLFFNSFQDLWRFLKPAVKKPLRAWMY
jgi:hypothetical protein